MAIIYMYIYNNLHIYHLVNAITHAHYDETYECLFERLLHFKQNNDEAYLLKLALFTPKTLIRVQTFPFSARLLVEYC